MRAMPRKRIFPPFLKPGKPENSKCMDDGTLKREGLWREIYMKPGICFVLMLAVSGAAGGETVIPLERAHSHNDYNRDRPLLDALACGFCSVEADIFLVDGRILVAHDFEDVTPENNLRDLYLDPLLARCRQHKGRIYPDGPPVTLLIDIKDNGERTWTALKKVLRDYEEMLTIFSDAGTREKAVTVILSGNRPRKMLEAESPRLAAMDGRLPDLKGDAPVTLIPLVSSSWTSAFRWKGIGDFQPEEKAKLRELVNKAHAQGRRIRFWGLPLAPLMWEELYEAGVDLLNADQIAKLRDMLIEKQRKKTP
jgi:hypothetical protein